MSQHEERYLDSIPAYVLGALDAAETAELERHLEDSCRECDAEMLRCTRDLEALVETTAPVAPAETTRARLLAEVSRSARPAAATPGRQWQRAAAAAVVALLAWSAVSQVGLRRRVDELAALRQVDSAELVRLESALDRARQRLDRYALASRIAASPDLETVRLAGLEAAPDASAQALIAGPDARAVFYASNLEPNASGKTYQLWVIVGGEPVSAGTFDVDADGSGSLVIETLDSPAAIEAWAVTLEPAGGVPQPTGPMVLLGSVA